MMRKGGFSAVFKYPSFRFRPAHCDSLHVDLWHKGENVLIADQDNNKLARGLASFSSSEILKIMGRQSSEIERILGYASKTEVIHKDDMVKL